LSVVVLGLGLGLGNSVGSGIGNGAGVVVRAGDVVALVGRVVVVGLVGAGLVRAGFGAGVECGVGAGVVGNA
jgi:hypothetical protein